LTHSQKFDLNPNFEKSVSTIEVSEPSEKKSSFISLYPRVPERGKSITGIPVPSEKEFPKSTTEKFKVLQTLPQANAEIRKL